MTQSDSAGARSGASWPEIAIGLGVLALALLIFEDTWTAPPAPGYAKVGPAAFPYGIAALFGLIGVLLTLAGFRGSWRNPEEEAALGATQYGRFLWVLAGLLVNVLLIEYIGFILASTLLFAGIARGFASTRPLRDVTYGFLLAFISYVGFVGLLKIKLGPGLLEGMIDRVFQ